jgi:hypothetical protein
MIIGHAEWRIVRLRRLVGDGSNLADNYLSARKVQWQAAIAKAVVKHSNVMLSEIDKLWNEWSAQCERALLNGDADWFERQADAIRWTDTRTPTQKQRAHFNAKVVRLLEHATWSTHARQGEHSEDLTLTPAGKFTDAMASDIYNALEKRELPNGHLLVEGCRFGDKGRVMEAIHDIERQLQFALRNWRRKLRRSGLPNRCTTNEAANCCHVVAENGLFLRSKTHLLRS